MKNPAFRLSLSFHRLCQFFQIFCFQYFAKLLGFLCVFSGFGDFVEEKIVDGQYIMSFGVIGIHGNGFVQEFQRFFILLFITKKQTHTVQSFGIVGIEIQGL